MSISVHDFIQMEERLKQSSRKPQSSNPSETEIGKGGLHDQIMRWCDDQWPRWKYIHARTDKRSTIGAGIHDITVFAPQARVFLIEFKSKTGKLRQEQIIWINEMEKLKWKVWVVRSMQEFENVVLSITEKEVKKVL